jgi:hypothetical protein
MDVAHTQTGIASNQWGSFTNKKTAHERIAKKPTRTTNKLTNSLIDPVKDPFLLSPTFVGCCRRKQ